MPTAIGSLRRLILTPSLDSVTFDRRSFPAAPTEVSRRLEAIPQAVVCGFEWGIDARDQWEVERRLELVEVGMRGFAYEGATMAFTVLDAMGSGRRQRTRNLLLGPGAPHIFLAYIGIGFAMAKLPRVLWKKIMPDLTGSPYYPAMSWLAVDGYGFDLAYFHYSRWIEQQRRPEPYAWEGRSDYFQRAVDQGIGRALWFMHAAAVDDVAAAVRRFAPERQPDLWAGVGLAATFAGGGGSDDLAVLRRHAGEHSDELALGSVFATKARVHGGFVPPHSALATAALTGLSVRAANALADDTEPPIGTVGAVPTYETWRANIRRHFQGQHSAADNTGTC
ncbi:hypothetical protein F4553_003461 [Allocatelliglobosispora scoriae]|uniref:DUF1702 family protein n=1 Tax=Allocatelliglobosispora scoriae TaxID=643052 RepID=A0A841BTK6_9ACTN|nr:DUF1702 family protein [Allocatelliglobosispora scoriae]MBB5870082.1 hypothetical protein [Allocatelliglobosispora scoriae]